MYVSLHTQVSILSIMVVHHFVSGFYFIFISFNVDITSSYCCVVAIAVAAGGRSGIWGPSVSGGCALGEGKADRNWGLLLVLPGQRHGERHHICCETGNS